MKNIKNIGRGIKLGQIGYFSFDVVLIVVRASLSPAYNFIANHENKKNLL